MPEQRREVIKIFRVTVLRAYPCQKILKNLKQQTILLLHFRETHTTAFMNRDMRMDDERVRLGTTVRLLYYNLEVTNLKHGKSLFAHERKVAYF